MLNLKRDRFLYIPHISTLFHAVCLIYGLITGSPYTQSPVFFISFFFMAASLLYMKYRSYRGGIHLFLTSASLAVFNLQSLSMKYHPHFVLYYAFYILLAVLTVFLLELPLNIYFVTFISSLMTLKLRHITFLTKEHKVVIIVSTLMILFILFEAKRWMSQLQTDRIKSMRKAHSKTLQILGRVCEIRDEETMGHLKRVEIMVGLLTDCLMDQEPYTDYLTDKYREDIKAAAYLHDIGKIGISDNILNKPGKLTAEEFTVVKTHTVIGYSLLEDARHDMDDKSIFDMAQEIARHHHEKWDGTGYPDGLAGEEIPLSARIMAIVDVYDALISKRPYKDPFSPAEAMEIIKCGSGTHFDPVLARLFFEHSERIRRLLEKIRRVEKQHS